MPPNSKILLIKRGKINTKEGGTRQKPSKEKTETNHKENNIKKTPYNRLWKYEVG